MLQQMTVFDSDAVILDLEDSVLAYDKDAARDLVHNAILSWPNSSVGIHVRINDIAQPEWERDVAMLRNLPIASIVLPKASVDSVRRLAEQTDCPITALIETPVGLLDARTIAAHEQVQALLLGAEDWTKEMGVRRTKEGREIDYARQHLAVVCHAYHKEAIDTPWTDKDDLEGLARDAAYAKSLGFTAKAVIHPNHVDVVNNTFIPSTDEIQEARRIVQLADATDKGAFTLDGKMVDAPIIDKARALLARAARYGR
jgi:citrate lyase subunit beta/citryl-CoA lyase